MESYVVDGRLIAENEWKQRVSELRKDVDECAGLDTSFSHLKKELVNAVLVRAREILDANKKIGLFFSGGVDSTLIGFILKQHGIPFTAYTVGFQDEGTKMPEDVEESLVVAEQLGFEQKIIMLTLDAADVVFKKSAEILKENTNVVSLGVGGVVLAAAQAAKKDGITHFFGGLGSEELFAGYQRHDLANKNSEALQEECWNGLVAMWGRDLVRDCAIANALKISVHTPFLDPAVIRVGMAIPASEKIKAKKNEKGVDEQVKKYCLRVVAEELKLPAAFAWRPKRAAQYGSRLDSALDKLAKKANLSSKSDYIAHILIAK